MTGALLRLAAIPALAAAFGGQFLLQRGELRGANEVRSARTLRTAPSSLAFRLAAGGVKEAAADALWLTVLPKLGQPWVEKERKGAWIEAVTNVMIDANPRALTPPLYAAYFLEFIDKHNPAIERVLTRAMEAERHAPFQERLKVNAGSWELPHEMAMNLFIYGGAGQRPRAMAWLKLAASRPDCPAIVIDLVGAEGSRRGNPLEGWSLYLVQAAVTTNRAWRVYYLRQADQARVAALRDWARKAESRLGRWPERIGEVLEEAPEAVKDMFRTAPALREDLVRDVVLEKATRDLLIPALADAQEAEGLADLRLLGNHLQNTVGRKARDIKDLEGAAGRRIPPPPRHGTKWILDPASGAPRVVPDAEDARMRK